MLVGLVVDVGRTAVRVPLGERHGESSFGGAIGWVLSVKGVKIVEFRDAMGRCDARCKREIGREETRRQKKTEQATDGNEAIAPKGPKANAQKQGTKGVLI